MNHLFAKGLRLPQCCRCKQFLPQEDFVPLVDSYNRWDGRTYRNWCLRCWATRSGALPPSDPNFYVPRNMRTRRFDKLTMGVPAQSAKEIKEQAPAMALITKDAFTEVHMPTTTIERLMDRQHIGQAPFDPTSTAPTAQDILSLTGRKQASKTLHPSNIETDSGESTLRSHACEFDGAHRTLPCDYCGLP